IIPIVCTLGWSLTASGRAGEERTFVNFPMQGNDAEAMRLVFARAGDLPIIGCAHDSFLLEDYTDRIEQTAPTLQAVMQVVSRDLFGFELRADCKPDKDIVHYPDRFVDKREREDGLRHWNWLMRLIEEAEDDEKRGRHGSHGRDVEGPDGGLRATGAANDKADAEATQAEVRV